MINRLFSLWYKCLLVVLLLAMALSAAENNDPKIIVGIAPFRGDSSKMVQLKQLGERLRDELMQTGVWQIVEQDRQSAINQEMAAAQAGCFETSCLMKAGQMMGVQKMVIPSLSYTAGIFTLQARLLDLQSGKVERQVLLDSKGKFSELLSKDISRLANQLIGTQENASQGVSEFDSSLVMAPVAILDMEAFGVEENFAKGLRQRLGAELFATKRFLVMEREEMQAILQEQAFQQSQCSGDECVVHMGQLVGVDYMVAASVSRIGNMFSVSARLINVATGGIERTATVDVEADEELVLKETINDVARVLAGQATLPRFNKIAWAWTGGGVALLATAGYFLNDALYYHDLYDKEQYSIDRLSEFKDSASEKYWMAAISGGLSLISFGVASYHFLVEKKEIRSQSYQQKKENENSSWHLWATPEQLKFVLVF